jgi:hypothetical protein
MSRLDEMHIRWTAALVDPSKSSPVGDGSGLTPSEAYDRLIEHLRWTANREHSRVGQIDAALEVALRDEFVSATGRAEAS